MIRNNLVGDLLLRRNIFLGSKDFILSDCQKAVYLAIYVKEGIIILRKEKNRKNISLVIL